MKRIISNIIVVVILSVLSVVIEANDDIKKSVDVCVYGATPSGIMAAIAVKKGDKSVVIIEPSRWVGGILGAGIKPRNDCPNVEATGGMTRAYIDKLGGAPASTRKKFLKLWCRSEYKEPKR